MPAIISMILWNVCMASLLAIGACFLGRRSFIRRRPALLHLMWFGVLLRLIIPPLVAVPVLPDTSVKLRFEADFTQVVPQNISLDVVPITTSEPAPAVAPEQESRLKPWLVAGWMAIVVWAAGTLVLMGLCLHRSIRLSRIASKAQPAPTSLIDLTAHLAREYGIFHIPGVRVVNHLASPALWFDGWQATILIPSHLIEEFDEEQWSYVLSHELAHLSRRDYLVNLIAVGVLYLYWWNPVAWWAWRELRACQEACCDAWVLSSVTTSRRSYAETLLYVVDACQTASPLPAQVAVGFGDKSVLTRRIEMIADPSVRPRIAMFVPVCFAALALSLFCLPVRADKPAPSASKPPAVSAQTPKDTPKAPKLVTLKYDDGTPDGKRSIAGTGMMIQFEKPDSAYQLKSLKLHCARYGTPAPPKEDVTFSILNEEGSEVIHTEMVPYAKFKRGESLWTTIAFKDPVDVPDKFWVVVEFNAERTKGVYLSFDTSTGGEHSKVGLPGQESAEVTTGGDWMIQAILAVPKSE